MRHIARGERASANASAARSPAVYTHAQTGAARGVQPAAAQPVPATPTPRPAQVVAAAPAEPGVITSFEPMGTWRRGDEAYGTLEQSTAEAESGSASAELRYDFPAESGSSNYVVFLPQPALRIPAGATRLEIQVYGDGSGNFLNAWVGDSAGQTWQFTFGRINHTGWAPMPLDLTPNRDRPNGPIGDVTADELSAPLYLKALVLDGASDGVASSGVIYLDNLSGF